MISDSFLLAPNFLTRSVSDWLWYIVLKSYMYPCLFDLGGQGEPETEEHNHNPYTCECDMFCFFFLCFPLFLYV